MAEVTVEALMAFRGQKFLEASFNALLGRAPDPQGLAYYLSRLARGVDRLDVLRDLRASAEARGHGADVTGLVSALRTHEAVRIPVIGSALCFAIYGCSKRTFKQLNILAEQMESIAYELTKHPNRFSDIHKEFTAHQLPKNHPDAPVQEGLLEAPGFDESNLRALPRQSLFVLRSIS